MMGRAREVFYETATDWYDDAACQGMPSEAFYTFGPVPADIAAICRACPVQRQCLAFAMRAEGNGTSTQYRFGIWGGTSANERARLARDGWTG